MRPGNSSDIRILSGKLIELQTSVSNIEKTLKEDFRFNRDEIQNWQRTTCLLNSLQMGFRTLAIQKQSSDIWRVLGAVMKEFEKFGGMLEKA